MPVKPKGAPVAPAAVQAPTAADLVDFGGDSMMVDDTVPDVDPCPPYLLAYYPTRWTIVGGRCVPALARIAIQKGINNCEDTVDVSGRVVPNWREAVKAAVAKGATVIPHAKGPGGRSYLQRITVKHGHAAHLTVFETAHKGSKVITSDLAAYANWIDGLFADGTLSPPPAYALETLRERLVSELAQFSDRAVTQPSIKTRIVEHEKAIASVDAVLAKFGTGGAVAGSNVELD